MNIKTNRLILLACIAVSGRTSNCMQNPKPTMLYNIIKPVISKELSGNILESKLSPNLTYIFSKGKLIHIKSGTIKYKAPGKTDLFRTKFSPNSKWIAISIDDNKNSFISLINLNKECSVKKFGEASNFKFSPDSRYLLLDKDRTFKYKLYQGTGYVYCSDIKILDLHNKIPIYIFKEKSTRTNLISFNQTDFFHDYNSSSTYLLIRFSKNGNKYYWKLLNLKNKGFIKSPKKIVQKHKIAEKKYYFKDIKNLGFNPEDYKNYEVAIPHFSNDLKYMFIWDFIDGKWAISKKGGSHSICNLNSDLYKLNYLYFMQNTKNKTYAIVKVKEKNSSITTEILFDCKKGKKILLYPKYLNNQEKYNFNTTTNGYIITCNYDKKNNKTNINIFDLQHIVKKSFSRKKLLQDTKFYDAKIITG